MGNGEMKTVRELWDSWAETKDIPDFDEHVTMILTLGTEQDLEAKWAEFDGSLLSPESVLVFYKHLFGDEKYLGCATYEQLSGVRVLRRHHLYSTPPFNEARHTPHGRVTHKKVCYDDVERFILNHEVGSIVEGMLTGTWDAPRHMWFYIGFYCWSTVLGLRVDGFLSHVDKIVSQLRSMDNQPTKLEDIVVSPKVDMKQVRRAIDFIDPGNEDWLKYALDCVGQMSIPPHLAPSRHPWDYSDVPESLTLAPKLARAVFTVAGLPLHALHFKGAAARYFTTPPPEKPKVHVRSGADDSPDMEEVTWDSNVLPPCISKISQFCEENSTHPLFPQRKLFFNWAVNSNISNDSVKALYLSLFSHDVDMREDESQGMVEHLVNLRSLMEKRRAVREEGETYGNIGCKTIIKDSFTHNGKQVHLCPLVDIEDIRPTKACQEQFNMVIGGAMFETSSPVSYCNFAIKKTNT